MQRSNFDFSKIHVVDYNIDFKEWPPSSQALAFLKANYGSIEVYEPRGNSRGYVQIQIRDLVKYDRVVEMQRKLSADMAQFGGVCESWGVLQD
jgi:hypothetical protein